MSAMLDMFKQLGTLPGEKVKAAFPEAGDHVIACELKSDSYQQVLDASVNFAIEIIKMPPAN